MDKKMVKKDTSIRILLNTRKRLRLLSAQLDVSYDDLINTLLDNYKIRGAKNESSQM